MFIHRRVRIIVAIVKIFTMMLIHHAISKATPKKGPRVLRQ